MNNNEIIEKIDEELKKNESIYLNQKNILRKLLMDILASLSSTEREEITSSINTSLEKLNEPIGFNQAIKEIKDDIELWEKAKEEAKVGFITLSWVKQELLSKVEDEEKSTEE